MNRTRNDRIDIRILILCFVVFLVSYFFSPVKYFVVSGPSMMPTLHNRQIILVDQRVRNLKDGDIGVFIEDDGEAIVKRVLRVEGESIWETADPGAQHTIVDNQSAIRLFTMIQARPFIYNMHLIHTVVPKGSVYIEGDNKSLTIRGLRPLSSVCGKVIPPF